MSYLGRDPIARINFLREIVPKDLRVFCNYCGRREARFRYGLEHDGLFGKPYWDIKTFCSRQCRDNYYGRFE